MYNLKPFLLGAASLLLYVSCNHANENKTELMSVVNSDTEKTALTIDSIPAPGNSGQVIAGANGSNNDLKNKTATNAEVVDWDKKIIKTATLSMEVKDFKAFSTKANEVAKNYGGYISSEQQSENEYKIENKLTIKVPVAQFEGSRNELCNAAAKLTERSVTSEDVSSQIVDTRSRIEAKRQVREKYLEFLKQAKNMEEVLHVQSEVNGIQEELESSAGRVQFLSHNAAYSTINLTYFQVLDAKASVSSEPTLGDKMKTALRGGWDFIVNIFLGLLTIWPLGLIIIAVWMAIRKRTAKVNPLPPVQKDN